VREDGLPTSSTMGEGERGAGDCGGAKGMVPRVIPGFGKTEVCRELRPGVRKRLLPVRLGKLDGSFEVAGTCAYMQCEDNVFEKRNWTYSLQL
jgi:hypothetical protein